MPGESGEGVHVPDSHQSRDGWNDPSPNEDVVVRRGFPLENVAENDESESHPLGSQCSIIESESELESELESEPELESESEVGLSILDERPEGPQTDQSEADSPNSSEIGVIVNNEGSQSEESEGMPERDHGRIRPREARQRGLLRLCVWQIFLYPREAYATIRARDMELSERIATVERVLQRDGRQRMDFYIDCSHGRDTAWAITSLRRVLPNCYVREHRSYTERLTRRGNINAAGSAQERHRRALQGSSPTVTLPARLRVATLNVNGMASKRGEVSHFLRTHHIDVCCLQETLRRHGDWSLRLPGYEVAEVLMDRSGSRRHFRGLAVAICSKRLSGFRVGPASRSVLFVKVFPKTTDTETLTMQGGQLVVGKEGLIIGCVYLPANGDANLSKKRVRSEILQAAGAVRRQYPGSPLIILGDWNSSGNRLMRHISHFQTRNPGLLGQVALAPIQGSRATRLARSGRPSELDHALILANGHPEGVSVDRSWVDRRVDISDHWPLLLSLDTVSIAVTEERNEDEEEEGGLQEGMVSVGRMEMADGEWVPVRVLRRNRQLHQRMNRRRPPREPGQGLGIVGPVRLSSGEQGWNDQAQGRLREEQEAEELHNDLSFKINRRQALEASNRVGFHNYWEVLLESTEDDADNDDPEVLAEALISGSEHVARDLGLVVGDSHDQNNNNRSSQGPRLSRRTRRLIRLRRRLYRQFVQLATNEAASMDNHIEDEDEGQSDDEDEEEEEDEVNAIADRERGMNSGQEVSSSDSGVRQELSGSESGHSMSSSQSQERWETFAIEDDDNNEISRDLSGNPSREEVWERYTRIRELARRSSMEDRQQSWIQHVQRGVDHYVNRDHRQYWRFLKGVMGGSSQLGGKSLMTLTMPVRDPEDPDTLRTDPSDIARCWALHYGRLLADVTGNSQNDEHWEAMIRDDALPEVANNADDENGINADIRWSEVRKVIKEAQNGKASGEDAIPAEWLKCALSSQELDEEGNPLQQEEDHRNPEEPPSPMARLLFRTIRSMWKNGRVPERWGHAVGVSIPKKSDDPTNMNNSRGLSLISVTLKLLCRILALRLASTLEQSEFFVQNQAGFRSREEAVAQASCLYEILRRRQVVGAKSYVGFLDFRKAYDTVPHGALFRKLRRAGIQGRMLDFIKALYQQSSLCIQSEAAGVVYILPVLRGLRQGCPLSPILFNIFINDIFDGMEESGAAVPIGFWGSRGGRRPVLRDNDDSSVSSEEGGEERSGQSRRCSGLAFADDVAVVAGSLGGLEAQFSIAYQWAQKWEMTFGVQKCGCMIVGGDESDYREMAIFLGDQRVPNVDKYVYLGVLITNSLDIEEMAKFRLDIFRSRIHAARAFLRNQLIPILARSAVIRALILPSYTYGGELFGMSAQRVDAARRLLTLAMRWVVGLPSRSPIFDEVACMRELRLDSVHLTCSSLRARLFRKVHTLRSWLSVLAQRPMTGVRLRTWCSQSLTWLKGKAPEYLELGNGQWEDGTGSLVTGNDALRYSYTLLGAKNKLRDRLYAKYPTTMTNRLYQRSYYFQQSQGIWQQLALQRSALGKGLTLYGRARLRALWTARQQAFAGLIPGVYRNRCPFCLEEGQWENGEDLTHLLVECSIWEAEREEFMGDALRLFLAIFTYQNQRRNVGSARMQTNNVVFDDDMRAMLPRSGGREPRGFGLWFNNYIQLSQEELVSQLEVLGPRFNRALRGLLLGGQYQGFSLKWYHGMPKEDYRALVGMGCLSTARYLESVFGKRRRRLRGVVGDGNRNVGNDNALTHSDPTRDGVG